MQFQRPLRRYQADRAADGKHGSASAQRQHPSCFRQPATNHSLSPGIFIFTCNHGTVVGFVFMKAHESEKVPFDEIVKRCPKGDFDCLRSSSSSASQLVGISQHFGLFGVFVVLSRPQEVHL